MHNKGHNIIPKPENDDTTHMKSSRTPHEQSANSENNNKNTQHDKETQHSNKTVTPQQRQTSATFT
jgi:hypothetical protein